MSPSNFIPARSRPRPTLREIPLSAVKFEPGSCTLTIDVGAWDALTESAYEDGWTLLEIRNERPARAFRRELVSN